MTEQLDVQQMAQRLLAADNILILCHKNPDGDTIGCGSALYYALKALEKTTAVLCSDAIPSRYAFTNPRLFKGEFEPRTVIAVDVAGLQLFGENNGVPQFARHVDLCIDHHAGNNGYADFTLLDAGAAAAAELLYQVIVEMGVTITPHIADCLYTGIATDTGCFKFSSTTANTHTVAAKLIEAGCHVEELNTLLFDTKPRARMEAERIARNHLEYYLDGPPGAAGWSGRKKASGRAKSCCIWRASCSSLLRRWCEGLLPSWLRNQTGEALNTKRPAAFRQRAFCYRFK